MCQAPKAAVEALPPKESNGVQRNGDAMLEGQDRRGQWHPWTIGWIHVNHKHRPTGSSFLWLNIQWLVTQILPSMQLQEASACKPISIYEQLKQKDWAQSFYWAQSLSYQCRWLPSNGPQTSTRWDHVASSTLSQGSSWTQSQRVNQKTGKTWHLASIMTRGAQSKATERKGVWPSVGAEVRSVMVLAVASFASTRQPLPSWEREANNHWNEGLLGSPPNSWCRIWPHPSMRVGQVQRYLQAATSRRRTHSAKVMQLCKW